MEERGWGWKKRKKKERMEAASAAVRDRHWPATPPPTPFHIVCGGFEAWEPLEGVERRRFNQIFIKCKAVVTPPPTCIHRCLYPREKHAPMWKCSRFTPRKPKFFPYTACFHLQVINEPCVVELLLFSVDRFGVDVHLPVSLGVNLHPEEEEIPS